MAIYKLTIIIVRRLNMMIIIVALEGSTNFTRTVAETASLSTYSTHTHTHTKDEVIRVNGQQT